MSTEPIEMHDVEATHAAGPEQRGEVDNISEPSLAIGQDVFRNRQRLLEKRRMIALVLGVVAVCLLISTITLAVLYGKLLQHDHDSDPRPFVVTATVTVHHTLHHTTTYSSPTPVQTTSTSTSSAVETNALPQILITTVTASTTNIAISPATPQPTQCWPGSVWGGADLRKVNEGYAVLMGVALSTSQLGLKGLATDYDLVALRSIFLCGESMKPGELLLLDVCKAAYVSQGDTTRCDESGSELRNR